MPPCATTQKINDLQNIINMKEFVLLFRMDITSEQAQPTKEQMKIYMEQWTEWINSIVSKVQLAEGGHHFSREGRVLKPNNEVIESPHVAGGNSVAGYIVVTAKDFDEATKIAKKCPILKGNNTSVEIRETAMPGA